MKMAFAVRIRGKGSVRRKKKAAHKTTAATNDMKMAGAVRTGGKGSVTRKKKKKAVHKTTTTGDKRPLKRTGNGNPSLGSPSRKQPTYEEIDALYRSWNCHDHDSCTDSDQEPFFYYPPGWEILSVNNEDDDDPSPSITEDQLRMILLTPLPSPRHHY